MSEKNILPQYVEVPQSDVEEAEKAKPKISKKLVILGVAAIVLINILGSFHFAPPCGRHLQPHDGPAPPPGRFHHGGLPHPKHHMDEPAESDSDSDSDDENELHEVKPKHHPRPKGVKFKGDELHDGPNGADKHEGKPHHRVKGKHHKGKGPHHKGKGPHDKHRNQDTDEEGKHFKGKRPHDSKHEESLSGDDSDKSNDDLNSVGDSSEVVAVEAVHVKSEEKAEFSNNENNKLKELPSAEDVQEDSN